jgi:hypothetical protein
MKKIYWFTNLIYQFGFFSETVANIILKHNDFDIDLNSHYTILENSEHKITFWSSNKYYAYFSSGELINKKTNKTYNWKDERPSRKTLNAVINKVDEIIKKSVNN